MNLMKEIGLEYQLLQVSMKKFHENLVSCKGTNETYYKNYIFDDISGEFNALNDEFTLKSDGSNISGIENENAIILVNDVFQAPGISDQYVLEESAGITSVRFQGPKQHHWVLMLEFLISLGVELLFLLDLLKDLDTNH